jgi:hypothetical protein
VVAGTVKFLEQLIRAQVIEVAPPSARLVVRDAVPAWNQAADAWAFSARRMGVIFSSVQSS